MQITLEQYEKINPVAEVAVDDKRLLYCTPSNHTLWRVQTLFQKEPDTIAWLNSFAPDSVLYDVGANVGMYSIYAAVVRGTRVLAFEPESQNFALLNKNIFANQVSGLVTAYPLAMTDKTAIDQLHLSNFMVGGSCHNFGEQVDFDGKPFNPGFSQGCFAMPMNDLVEKFGFARPDYIKIDVDGLEHLVVSGGDRILTEGVKSVLIEINTNREDHRGVIAQMEALGYRWDEQQVQQYIRKDGPFKGTGNHIFYRD